MEKKQTNENRKFLGIWIPKEIYLNNDLSWTDKILVIEILSLDNERGCFASNDYFAEFLGVTKTTISTSISKLKELGFIEQISFDGRTRILKAVYKKIDNPHTRKLKGRIQENLKHNNTVNKTTNKTIKKEKKYIQKIDENLKDEKPKLSNDPVINTKVNSILNGATYINVEDLKKERDFIESIY
jgi:DNA-binding transcriptional regulator GbsR (MarR family)